MLVTITAARPAWAGWWDAVGDRGRGYGYEARLRGLAMGDVGHDYGYVARLGGLAMALANVALVIRNE